MVVADESKRARTRTSLIGATIYQPDLEPSAKGRRLPEALDSILSAAETSSRLAGFRTPLEPQKTKTWIGPHPC